MRRHVFASSVPVILLAMVPGILIAQTDRTEYLERARELLRESPLIDGHNDLPWEARINYGLGLDSLDIAQRQDSTMTDIPRLREGLVGGQFWVAYVPSSFHHRGAPRVGMEQVDFIHQMVERYHDLEFAGTADEVVAAFESGRVASLIGLEGGHIIENSLGLLRQFYDRGVRYMTLTHSRNTDWADASTDSLEHGGLTAFGEEVVHEMNRLGMMVDLSHVSDSTMWDVLRVTHAPVIFSHSSARHFTPHRRNVPDDVLRAVAENDGVVMVNYVTSFIYLPTYEWEERSSLVRDSLVEAMGEGEASQALFEVWREANERPLPGIETVADHIEHIRDVAGIDHVGIGADLDGIGSTPIGLEDVSTFPDLIAELLARGWEGEEIHQFTGRNILRVMRAVERVATELQATTSPSTARIEEVDHWAFETEWREPRED